MSDRATLSSRYSRSTRKSKAAALQALRTAVEPLENRLLFATAAYSAGVFTLTGLTNSVNNVTVTSPATDQVKIVLGNGDSFTSSPGSADFVPSQTSNPNDTLTINTGPSNSPISTFNLDLGSAADTVNFSLPGTNGVSNVVIDTGANSDLVTIGTVNINGNLQDTGGAITISPSAQVTTNGGNITLTGTGNPADVVGVNVNGATLNAGSGSITFNGSGAGSVSGSSHFGVEIQAGALVETTGTGAISISGTGGNSPGSFDHGVLITGTSSVVAATGGISITGTGALASSMGSGGVEIDAAATVNATGAGGISISGTGGSGTGIGKFGVEVRNELTAGGNITITGTGGGTGSSAFGVVLSATGTDVSSSSGAVTISGTGAPGGNNNYGVSINGLVMAGTNVTITGTGAGTGMNSFGVELNRTGADVNSGGAVVITGIGAAGTNTDYGVLISGSVSGSTGVTITGTGGGTGIGGFGVELAGTGADVNSGGAVTITGSGASAASATSANDYGVRVNGSVSGTTGVTITGTGTGGGNFGVLLAFTGTSVASSSGGVAITGTGASGGNTDFGVRIDGTVTAHANVNITGTGGGNGGNSFGVYLANLGTDVSSSSGDVSITGTGAAGSGYNYGVWVDGTVMAGTNVTITGTGGGTGGNSFGVLLNNGGTDIDSDGVVTITGSGPAAAGSGAVVDYGVRANGLVSGSTGVTITGTGTGDSGNFGVYLGDEATAVASTSGAVAVSGTGAADGTYDDYGVRIDGTVMAGTNVTIVGTGGGTGSSSFGVLLDPTVPAVNAGGSVTITGSAAAAAGADANADYGVLIDGPVSGSSGVTITGTGTGGGIGSGNGATNNFGVDLNLTGTAVASSSGAVSISGSGANGTGDDYGVQSYGTVTASTNVTITGTGAGTGDFSFGVALAVAGTAVNAGGTVSITGSGAAGTATDYGVFLQGAVSGSTGITITGTGSNSGPGTDAIFIAGATLTASAIITLDPSSGTALLPSGTTDTLTALSMNLKTGTLQVDANVLGTTTPIIVENTTTLDGTGSIAGTVELQSGATLIPGYSETPGILTTGGLSAVSGANVNYTVNGPIVKTGYSQLDVNGSVSLGSATLNLAGTIPSSAGQTVTLIKNGGGSAVGGIFSGYVEGAPVTLNGLSFQISYIGGSGHNVVLTQGGVKAGPVIHAFDMGGVYNGAPFAATGFVYVGTTPVATPVFTYYNLSDKALRNPLPGAPVNAGSYFFVAKFAGNSTYPATQTSSGPITITKAQPVIHASDLGGVYNGKPFPATGSVYLGVTPVATPVFKYYNFSDKTKSHPLAGAPTNPGKYFFTATYAGNSNLLPTSTSSGEFDITIPVTSFTASPVHVVVGATFNGVVAQFSAPASLAASLFTATINWGDGTTATTGTVSAETTKGKFQVVGSNKWTKKGPFTITITLVPTGTTALTAKVTTT